MCFPLRDTLPVFLKQLHQLAVVTELSGWESKRIAALLGLAESAICLAAVTPDQLRLVEGRTELAAPCVEWVHVVGLCAPLMRALVTWTRAHAAHTPDHNSLVVIGALLNTVATYYEKLRHKASWFVCIIICLFVHCLYVCSFICLYSCL